MLRTIYLRCDPEVAPNYGNLRLRIDEAIGLGVDSVRVVGSMFGRGPELLDILGDLKKRGIRISGDIEVEALADGSIEVAKHYVADLAVNVNPARPVRENMDFRGLTLNLSTSRESVSAAVPLARRMLGTHSVKLVKFSANLPAIGNANAYLGLVQQILTLADEFPEQVYALLPWVLVDQEHLRVTRTVCNYGEVIGLFLDGTVTACKVGIERCWPPQSMRTLPLAEILHVDPLVSSIHSLEPHHLTGVCSKCIFRDYCGNLCLARVFSVYGSFAAPFPDCQMLYDAGLFPEEYLDGRP